MTFEEHNALISQLQTLKDKVLINKAIEALDLYRLALTDIDDDIDDLVANECIDGERGRCIRRRILSAVQTG